MKKTVNNSKLYTVSHLYVNVIFNLHDKNAPKAFFDEYLKSLKKDIINFKNKYHSALKTIYIGGKSLKFLTNSNLKSLLELLQTCGLENIIEYSFEYQYGMFNEETLEILKQHHVNRLVWRVKTFDQKLLEILNEGVNITKITTLITNSIKFGFNNFWIDLNFQIPGQTLDHIYYDLASCLKLQAPHISYESYFDFQEQKIKKIVCDFLVGNGYQQYECFSYAKDEKSYSQQTLAYLRLENWHGIGPEAYGFLKSENQYIITKNSNNFLAWEPFVNKISKEDYYQLILTQGLMLRSGLFINKDSLAAIKHYRLLIDKLIGEKQIIVQNNYLRATNDGWLLLNEVLTTIINGN